MGCCSGKSEGIKNHRCRKQTDAAKHKKKSVEIGGACSSKDECKGDDSSVNCGRHGVCCFEAGYRCDKLCKGAENPDNYCCSGDASYEHKPRDFDEYEISCR